MSRLFKAARVGSPARHSAGRDGQLHRHRVVRQDGALGGYRWGVARKRKLVERETQAARK